MLACFKLKWMHAFFVSSPHLTSPHLTSPTSELALISFQVYDEDQLTEDDFIAQFVVPFSSIREGMCMCMYGYMIYQSLSIPFLTYFPLAILAGYSHLRLRSNADSQLSNTTLFVYTRISSHGESCMCWLDRTSSYCFLSFAFVVSRSIDMFWLVGRSQQDPCHKQSISTHITQWTSGGCRGESVRLCIAVHIRDDLIGW